MQKKCRRRIDNKALVKEVIKIAATKMLSVMRTTPLGVMVITGIVFLQAEALPAALSSSMLTISYMILIFGMTITFCFNSSRLFFILLVIFLSQLGMTSLVLGHIDKIFALQSIYSLISLLLPLNLLYFSLLSERVIVSGWGQRNLNLILLQVIFIMGLILSGDRGISDIINAKLIFLSFMPQTPIPHSAVIAFIVAGALLLTKRRRTTVHFKVTIFSTLVAIACAHHFSSIPIAVPLFYATAGLLIIVSVIQDYYFKAYLDELTALPSRRSLNENMMKLDGIYVIAMVDVDHFKKFNDTYGHDAGDDVLRLIASIMKQCKNGKSFRYGGEEFTILFPGKGLDEVAPYLEELRRKIAECKFILRGESKVREGLNITVSIGAAESTHKSINPKYVIKAADEALYGAKNKGRNCVHM